MKKMNLLLVFALAFLQVYAQKLPKVQQVGMLAPATIKINGRADEFKNQYQAYNPSTELLYTIANNKEDLYIIFYADSYNVMKRIMENGLTFSVKNNTGDKSFIFPAYDFNAPNTTNLLDFNLSPFTKETSPKDAKSRIDHNNQIEKEKHKLIKVKGFKGIDTLIAIYNDKGIRVSGLFNDKNHYTLEMAISLKLLGLSINDKNSFNYQIKVNGNKFYPIIALPDRTTGAISPEFAEMTAKANERVAQRSAPTYFEGKYILAK